MFPSTSHYGLHYGIRGRDTAFGDFENLIEQFFGRPSAGDSFILRRGENYPPIAIAEGDSEFAIEAEIPGVPLESLEISVTGNELTIKGKRRNAAENTRSYHRQERFSGEFTRVIKLGAEIDAGRISAAVKDGVLTVRLPKGEAAKPRKIEVRGQ